MEMIWQRLQRSLKELQQGLDSIEMERGEMAYIPKIIRRGTRMEISELSDGYQAILARLSLFGPDSSSVIPPRGKICAAHPGPHAASNRFIIE